MADEKGEGNSQYTRDRASSANVSLVSSDVELVGQADYIFSIVPPRDCLAIAHRISTALKDPSLQRIKRDPLYFLDLNATSPLTARKMAAEFDSVEGVRILDGGIIGGPPRLLDDKSSWYKPSVVVSGPHPLHSAPASGPNLSTLLNVKHVADTLGPATGLKMCFASMNKGFVALAVQAMTTAEQLGVLPELQTHLKEYSPATGAQAERGVPNMCPKAYRWVGEMYEIADTMEMFGGFDGNGSGRGKGGDLFRSVGEIYRFVADDTELGQERIGERKRGKTVEDVAKVCAQNLKPAT